MKKPIILGLYGTSKTGKTAVITSLITWLDKQGFTVATVKNTNKPINIDTPGKDTFNHAEAGSKCVVFSTAVQTSFMLSNKTCESEIVRMLQCIGDYDVIFVEGARLSSIPKIRMDDERNLRENTLWTYHNDINKIKEYIKNELKKRDDQMTMKLSLIVNGNNIPLSEFPEECMRKTILGMISSLKGVDDVETVEISISD